MICLNANNRVDLSYTFEIKKKFNYYLLLYTFKYLYILFKMFIDLRKNALFESVTSQTVMNCDYSRLRSKLNFDIITKKASILLTLC